MSGQRSAGTGVGRIELQAAARDPNDGEYGRLLRRRSSGGGVRISPINQPGNLPSGISANLPLLPVIIISSHRNVIVVCFIDRPAVKMVQYDAPSISTAQHDVAITSFLRIKTSITNTTPSRCRFMRSLYQ